MKKFFSVLILLSLVSCSLPKITLQTDQSFDVKRYMGKWYEIARLPNSFEEDLEEVIAFYELKEDGEVAITNQGRIISNKSRYKEIKGRAWIPDQAEPSKFKISVFWPFSYDYWVLWIDKDYSIALVGSPNGKYLWILARDRHPDPEVISELKIFASSLGYPVEYLISGLAD